MIRGSDLALLKNQIFSVAKEEGGPKQREYFSLIFQDLVSPKEVSKAFGLAENSVNGSLKMLRDKILEKKPFLASPAALKYKGASRILKLLAIQCNRKNEAHNARDYSYVKLFKNVCDIIEDSGTEIQKEIYEQYFVKGKSQVAIAGGLGRCQPTIQKSVYGNYDATYGKHFGGIIGKVGKHLKEREVPYCCHLIEPYGSLLDFVFSKR